MLLPCDPVTFANRTSPTQPYWLGFVQLPLPVLPLPPPMLLLAVVAGGSHAMQCLRQPWFSKRIRISGSEKTRVFMIFCFRVLSYSEYYYLFGISCVHYSTKEPQMSRSSPFLFLHPPVRGLTSNKLPKSPLFSIVRALFIIWFRK